MSSSLLHVVGVVVHLSVIVDVFILIVAPGCIDHGPGRGQVFKKQYEVRDSNLGRDNARGSLLLYDLDCTLPLRLPALGARTIVHHDEVLNVVLVIGLGSVVLSLVSE